MGGKHKGLGRRWWKDGDIEKFKEIWAETCQKVERREPHLSTEEIGKLFGKSANAITGMAHALGLQSQHKIKRIDTPEYIAKRRESNYLHSKNAAAKRKQQRHERAKELGKKLTNQNRVYVRKQEPEPEPPPTVSLPPNICLAVVGKLPGKGTKILCSMPTPPGHKYCPEHTKGL